VQGRFFTQFCLLLVLLTCSGDSDAAAGDAPHARDQAIIAKLKQWPLIFFVAKGGHDACGPGCNKWIAADGLIDPDAAQRFHAFLAQPDLRSLPVFFNSLGGSASQSIAIGLILRQYRMTAAIGRTIPNSCHAAMPAECRGIALSKPEQDSHLVTFGARCASGCVYALLGASVRQVARYTELGIHSPRYVGSLKGSDLDPPPSIDLVDDELRAYLVEMGGDPGLIDFAASVRPERIHWMSREEIERYHIETRGYYETPWTAHQLSGGRFAITKSWTRNNAETHDYYTTVIRLACLNSFTYLVSYRSELPFESSGTKMRMAAAADVFEFKPNSDGVVWNAALPRDAMRRITTEPKIRISEVRGSNEFRESELSTAGLAQALDRLQQHCDESRGSERP
jgi:hypothetical protein